MKKLEIAAALLQNVIEKVERGKEYKARHEALIKEHPDEKEYNIDYRFMTPYEQKGKMKEAQIGNDITMIRRLLIEARENLWE